MKELLNYASESGLQYRERLVEERIKDIEDDMLSFICLVKDSCEIDLMRSDCQKAFEERLLPPCFWEAEELHYQGG